MIVKKDWDLLKIHSGNGFLKYNSYANFQIKSQISISSRTTKMVTNNDTLNTI